MTKGHARRPRLVSAVLLLVALAHQSSAQPVPSTPHLDDIFLPGGVERLFHAASLEPPRDRGYALLTLSRLIYAAPPGGDPEQDAKAARLREYLDVLGQWCARVEPFAKGVALQEAAQAKATRSRLEELLAFVGLALQQRGGKWLAEPHGDPDAARRRRILSAAGIDVDALAQKLNAEATVDLSMRGDTVPLPLGQATWLRAVFDDRVPAPALFALLTGEREALWLYGGLVGLDEDTRRFIESEPDLLAWIHRNRPALFGAFGRSVRIRRGRVQTPGGVGATAAWESLAGAPASQPAAFVRGLLQRDDGRLAWFYDTVAHLPFDSPAVTLGSAATPSDRIARFRSLYSAFLEFLPSWNLAQRPFTRRALDPALALQLVRVGANGLVAGPPWMSFWQAALARGDLPDRLPEEFGRLQGGEPASVGRVLGKVFAAAAPEHRARLDLVLFVGRLFHDIDEERAFDALVAARGFMRFPALMLVLEHMGIREPDVYREAARAAAAVSSSSGGSQALAVRVVQLQAAVALLDRLREVQALDVPSATTLVRDLFAARRAADGWYEGAILDWLEQKVLPALGHAPGIEPAEARLTMALAGVPRVPLGPPPALEWNGQRYRVDHAAAILARLQKVRGKQRATDLDGILGDRHRAAGDSASDRNADTGDGRSKDAPPGEADTFRTSAPSTLIGPPLPGSEPLVRRIDYATAEWLASLAYAVRIDAVDAPLLLGGNPALTHDLRLVNPRFREIGETAWSLPTWTRAMDGRTHVEGALLGLALPLARYAAERVRPEVPAHPPTVPPHDVAVILESISTFNASEATDAERDLIATALGRGGDQVADLRDHPGQWMAIAEKLHADEWERELIPWMLTHEPERVSTRFSAHDLFVLGNRAAAWPDGWGILARPLDGSLALRLPTPLLRRVLTNHGGAGMMITQFCDLQFRTAKYLADSHLPASLARPLLAMAVQDFLEGARLADDKDWPGVVSAAGAITDDRLAEYVAKMTTDGRLVRQAAAQEGTRRDSGAGRLSWWLP